MDQVWREDVLACLSEAMDFYNPGRWTETHNKIWIEALDKIPSHKILAGFQEYYKTGKHMPKPSEIIELIRERVTPVIGQKESQDKKPFRKCDPVIADAWRIYLRDFFDFKFGRPVNTLDHDQVIEIVNREASRTDQPLAVRPCDQIESYWKDKPYDPDDYWRKFTSWYDPSSSWHKRGKGKLYQEVAPKKNPAKPNIEGEAA